MKTTNYTQWYNENEGRSYPISETASKLSDDSVLLPDNIIVDMGIMVDPIYTDIYLSSVRITSRIVTVGISSPLAGLLVGTYIRDSVQPYTAYPLTGVVDNVSGWIVFGTHLAVTTENYRFATPAQSRIETRAIKRIEALPVKGILKAGGNPNTVLKGVVRIRGGGGVTISRSGTQEIYVALDQGTIHNIISPCNFPAKRSICKNTPIRTINGVPCDTYGNITLRFE